jgi:hypothetical protein
MSGRLKNWALLGALGQNVVREGFRDIVARDTRPDGIVISTIKPKEYAWFGEYETAVITYEWLNNENIKVVEAYSTLEEAKAGHQKYLNMPWRDLEALPRLESTQEQKEEFENAEN